MKLFVTGASGFIGQALVKRLVNDGHNVSVLVRKTSKLGKLKDLKINFFYGDLQNMKALEAGAKDADYVFHIAGVIHPVSVPDRFYWDANVKGTENVIKASMKSKNLKKFIYCSSVACYGHVDDDRNTVVDEDYPCHTENIYSKTKYAGEKVVEIYAKEHKLKYIILRPARVYGPKDLTLKPLFKLVKKGLFFNIGWDRRFMMPVYIDDLVDSFILSMEKPVVNKVYIIAGPEFMDKKEFINMIAKALEVKPRKISLPAVPVKLAAFLCEQLFKVLGKEPPISRKKLKFFLMSRKYSIEKARKELGYNPQFGLKEGMIKTVGWYKTHKLI